MAIRDLIRHYMDRIAEAKLYLAQGLPEGAREIFVDLLAELDSSGLPEHERARLQAEISSEIDQANYAIQETDVGPELAPASKGSNPEFDPAQAFQYGMALMDTQFWEEAIIEFKRAAQAGFRIMECREYCGDCAASLESWEEAIRYYESVYSSQDLPEATRQRVLLKLTRCSQTLKKIHARSSPYGRAAAAQAGIDVLDDNGKGGLKVEYVASSVTSIEQSSVTSLMGQSARSWADENGKMLTPEPCSYRIVNLVHVGITSQVVEVEKEGSAERFAGQIIAHPFNRGIDPKALSRWAHTQMMIDSVHLVRIHDVAVVGSTTLIIREHMPGSLAELLSYGQVFPIPVAVFFAYRILEGIGDLHLHMGRDEQIRNVFHLDLRPSRILFDAKRGIVKVNNGGLWRALELHCPEETTVSNIPLPFLSYRAPEQFRPYLARRRPPAFTDIYLFGILFYEMLTGISPFRASSYEEYEIQHCEQFPAHPKVWRPEIPQEINDIIMKCLETDPFRRWRSVTQISLIIEKAFSAALRAGRDGTLARFVEKDEGGRKDEG